MHRKSGRSVFKTGALVPVDVLIPILLAIMAAAGTAVWLRMAGVRTTPDALEHLPVPPTSDAAFESHAAFSPDGKQVAYSRTVDDHYSIHIKLIGVPGPPTRLTTEPGYDQGPTWSPDGRYIAFLRKTNPGGTQATVVRNPLTGGLEQALAEVSMPANRYFGPQLTWFPDG
jgi:dipeptidyl aminopeptidase/acylaminoacyl peptidase